ncbi:MAG TPA: Smr/MutS family protein [Planctomycetota bacterium]|nr:Smr/MutS family protein [Planctomycetota bacterium]HRR81554.1 Smr/MutS family protein [Planctomycetota bacterium]HRT93405.1 Smr/MutS family protein [Planctomycetota bacterium]
MPDEIKIDLHEVARDGAAIERELHDAFDEAQRLRVKCLQIVHGKGTGQLKRRVDRFLKEPQVKAVTRNIDHDSKNWGRLFIYFRWPERNNR